MDEDEPPKEGPDPEAWMLSFGDLVSLMLVFFVMLFSMSTLEKEEFEAVVSALSQQFNPSNEIERPKPSVDMDIPKIEISRAYDLDYLRALFAEKTAHDPILQKISIHQLHDRLIVSLPSDKLFDQGEAQLHEEAKKALFLLGDALRYISNRVDVNGHTDPDPVSSPIYTSNWELSLSRAIAVARELRRVGYQQEVHAFGLADSRFDDLSREIPIERRYALARRVDLVIRTGTAESGSAAR
jgi:chemotaxis protein MotB